MSSKTRGGRRGATVEVDPAALQNIERLLLAQAVYEFGSDSWPEVAKLLSKHPLISRPRNFFAPQSCNDIYVYLMNDSGLECSDENAKPHALVHRRLAERYYAARLLELKELIADEETKFKNLVKEIDEIRSGLWDAKITGEEPEPIVPETDEGQQAQEQAADTDLKVQTAVAADVSGSELSGVTDTSLQMPQQEPAPGATIAETAEAVETPRQQSQTLPDEEIPATPADVDMNVVGSPMDVDEDDEMHVDREISVEAEEQRTPTSRLSPKITEPSPGSAEVGEQEQDTGHSEPEEVPSDVDESVEDQERQQTEEAARTPGDSAQEDIAEVEESDARDELEQDAEVDQLEVQSEVDEDEAAELETEAKAEADMEADVEEEAEDEAEAELTATPEPKPSRRREGKRKASDLEGTPVDTPREKKRAREESEPVDDDEGVAVSSRRRRDRQLPNEEKVAQKRFQNVITMLHSQICQHRHGGTFHNPIRNSEAPDYHEIVKRPMDLKTIKTRIRDGAITNSSEFQRDIYLMLANAMMYNRPGSDIFHMAQEMMAESEAQINTFRQTEGLVRGAHRM